MRLFSSGLKKIDKYLADLDPTVPVPRQRIRK